MQEIFKRLELIKIAIGLEDEEIIGLQVMKLDGIEGNDTLKNIISDIANRRYGVAIIKIEDYLTQFSSVVAYDDIQLRALRLELKVLEQELKALNGTKNEYLNDIHTFNMQYHRRLGHIIEKILQIKKKILASVVEEKKEDFTSQKSQYEQLKQEYLALKRQKENKERELETIDEFDDNYDVIYEELTVLKRLLDEKEQILNASRKETKRAKKGYEEDPLSQEYEEILSDYKTFEKESQEVEKEEIIEISVHDKIELKRLYRKASRLCHPDLVSSEVKTQATETMKALNHAYNTQNLEAVKKILHSLQSGKRFEMPSDIIEDRLLLEEKIEEIRELMRLHEEELKRIEEDEIMQILKKNPDLDDYFDMIEEELELEYERLTQSVR